MKQAIVTNSLNTRLTNMNLLSYYKYAPSFQKPKHLIIFFSRKFCFLIGCFMVKKKEEGGDEKRHSLLHTNTHYKLKCDETYSFCYQYMLHRHGGL